MEHFSLIPTAFAQANANPCTSLGTFSTLCSLTSDDFGLVISTLINVLLIFTIIIAVFFFMYGGIKWVLSRGDKEKVEEARAHIIASIVGMILVFLAFFTINIVFGFFFPGKSIKDLSLPTLGPDTTPPIVSIIAPISDSNVLASAPIQATATDNKAVTKVEFYVDGLLKNTDIKEPFEHIWDTKLFKHNSVHTLSAKAYDAANNVGTSASINVIVIDVTKPTVRITNPVNNGKVNTNTIVTISAFATDVSEITQVEFRVNGVLKCTDFATPFICAWQVPPTKNVIYRIEATALDTAGNIGNSSNSVTSM